MNPVTALPVLICLVISTSASSQAVTIQKVNESSYPVAVSNIGFSPDGDTACFRSREFNASEPLRCGPSRTTSILPITSSILGSSQRVTHVTFSNDSAFVYFIQPDIATSELFRVDLKEIAGPEKISSPPGSSSDILFGYVLADQNLAYKAIRSAGEFLESVTTDALVEVNTLATQVQYDAIGRFQFNPDESRVVFDVYQSGARSLYSSTTDNTDLVKLTFPGAFLHSDAALSPDGDLVLYRSSAGGPGLDLFAVPIDGGQSVQLTTNTDSIAVDAPRFSEDGRNTCFYDFVNSPQFWLYCGPLDSQTSLNSMGHLTDYDEDEQEFGSGEYVPLGSTRVLRNQLVGLGITGAGAILYLANMDGSGQVRVMDFDVTHFETIDALQAVVYRQQTGSTRRWIVASSDQTQLTPLFEEESASAFSQFIDYSAVSDRLLFLRDSDPSAADVWRVYTIRPDGTDGQYLSDGFIFTGVDLLHRPRFSAAGTHVIYVDRVRSLPGAIRTRVRAAASDGSHAITLHSFLAPAGDPARHIASLAISPVDPLGTMMVAQTEEDPSVYDVYLTYSTTLSLLPFANGFENP